VKGEAPAAKSPGQALPPLLQRYTDLAKTWEIEAERLAARSRLISNLRGLSFAVAAISAISVLARAPAEIAGPIAFVALVIFGVLVLAHARLIGLQDLAERWVDVNRAALARARHDFGALSDLGEGLAPSDHAYAGDLDLFGRASLFQRLSVARTRFGRERLAEVLLEIATPAAAVGRQIAVKELAEDLELCQRFEAHALGVAGTRPGAGGRVRSPVNPEPLLKWAEAEPSLLEDALSRIGPYVLPPITLSALVGYFAFGLPGWPALIGLCLQALVLVRASRETGVVFAAVSVTEGAFLRFGSLLEIIEKLDHEAPLLRELRARLETSAGMPSKAMNRFKGLVGWFDLRHNGLLHPLVNLLVLWDLHCALALERWQRKVGKRLRGWFEVIGWFEALSSLASFARDEPDATYPELIEGPAIFEAEALGHPLIEPASRVANDVVLPGPGQALLVTGSNMSGKSTLLRAMGLSTVLALAGAPVVARRLRLSRLLPATSIRVADSLEAGVSHFYAEIAKLKRVVQAAQGPDPVLFLLDEILHGTNSRERQIGARWVLAELLSLGALGAISTHDQELCRLPDSLMSSVRLVHLRESVHDGTMTFDFKVYPGPVTSGNALRLMRSVGLDVPLE
jgi:hypothetical protein